LGFTFSKEH